MREIIAVHNHNYTVWAECGVFSYLRPGGVCSNHYVLKNSYCKVRYIVLIIVSLVLSSSSMFYLEMINSLAPDLNYSVASAEDQSLNESYIRRPLNSITLTWGSPF
jgi:hypothetical protein